MNISIEWATPVRLRGAKAQGLIYRIDDFEPIPASPGVYVFGRRKGKLLLPIYIGQAINLRSRIRRQLNNARLMMALKNAPSRGRFVWFAELQSKSGQKLSTTLNIVEKGFIDTAISEGIEIINIQGTVQRHHTVTSAGNLEARRWVPHRIWIKKAGR